MKKRASSMLREASIGAALALAVLGARPSAGAPAALFARRPLPLVLHGTMEHVRIPAPALHRTRQSVRVYLPPSYHQPRAARRRYPVIVLLHGWPGGDGNWLGQGRAAVTLDSLIARGAIPELIALMPNANGPGPFGRSRYIDARDGSFDIQEFVTRDLIRWADAALRTRPLASQRGIIGLSDGASGALDLTLRNPEVFGAAGGLSGFYRLHHVWGDERVLGPEPGASRQLALHSPAAYITLRAGSARGQSLFFACGLSDGMRGDNEAFHLELVRLGVPHAFVEAPGRHNWTFWKRHLREALRVVTAHMQTEG